MIVHAKGDYTSVYKNQYDNRYYNNNGDGIVGEYEGEFDGEFIRLLQILYFLLHYIPSHIHCKSRLPYLLKGRWFRGEGFKLTNLMLVCVQIIMNHMKMTPTGQSCVN